MFFLRIIFLVLFLAQSAPAGEKEFIAWWKNSNVQDKRRAVRKPLAITKGVEAVLHLHAQKNMTILLMTPVNIMKNITTVDDRYYEAMQKCSGDRSWIVLAPENVWSEVDLNPYCAESYGEDEISFVLYWVDSGGKPFIDIVTNGPACASHKLYGWDRKGGKYVLKADKCAS